MARPIKLVPCTLFVPPAVAGFLRRASKRMQEGGQYHMSADRLGSIAVLVGLAGISREEGAITLSDQFLAVARQLAQGAPLPGA